MKVMDMTKINESLSQALGVNPIPPKQIAPIPTQQEVIAPAPKEENIQDQLEDYDLSRQIFRSLISKGSDAIDDLYELSKASEHPRSYEVLATLIKTVSDTTKDLYDLQKKTKDLRQGSGDKKLDETNVTIDKAVFVGTTAELLDRFKKERVI